jgi:hypothetical protein
MHVEVNIVDEDLGDEAIIELETQHVISNMLNETKNRIF